MALLPSMVVALADQCKQHVRFSPQGSGNKVPVRGLHQAVQLAWDLLGTVAAGALNCPHRYAAVAVRMKIA